ncbi:MAG: CHAT domain-containing protein [Myxococcales bacterium]|nr:CHAT domain-containing protein [Myxococcales bacterium]
MDTISLEIVRQGPPNNQLLSPLVPYIALAGNRPAETIFVPTEHADMLAKLRRLRYPIGAEISPIDDAALRDVARVATTLFESVRGLGQAVAESRGPNARSETLHLRLVLSAQELAMIPFELAQGPTALGGSTELSALQPPPVVITRESRRVAHRRYRSPTTPKILFVFANPRDGRPVDKGFASVVEMTLLALRQAVDDRVPKTPHKSPAEAQKQRAANVRQFIDVLAAASIEDVRAAMESEAYTHVHILAHGGLGAEFGGKPVIALCDHFRRDEPSLVTGDALAAALTVERRGAGGARSAPEVVTLAVCHGGANRDVLYEGASIAHTLHSSGIPVVLGSHYELTYEGAVHVVREFYERLLGDEDPRTALESTRRRLFLRLQQRTSDWGALVLYASLAAEASGVDNVELAIRRTKRAIANVDPNFWGGAWVKRADRPSLLGALSGQQLSDEIAELERVAVRNEHATMFLANAHKHCANFVAGKTPASASESSTQPRLVIDHLAKSRSAYLRLLEQFNVAEPWVATQIALLSAILLRAERSSVGEDTAKRDLLYAEAAVTRLADPATLSSPTYKNQFRALCERLQLALAQLDVTNDSYAAKQAVNRCRSDCDRALQLMQQHPEVEDDGLAFFNLREFDRLANPGWLGKAASGLAEEIVTRWTKAGVSDRFRWRGY